MKKLKKNIEILFYNKEGDLVYAFNSKKELAKYLGYNVYDKKSLKQFDTYYYACLRNKKTYKFNTKPVYMKVVDLGEENEN